MTTKKKNPKNVRYDKDGVPRYSAQDIEKKGEEFLTLFDEGILEKPGPTPFGAIAKRLKEEYGIVIDFDTDLGFIKSGADKIIGKFLFKPRSILIDNSLLNDIPRFNFTFAHEIGHLVLHRKLKLKADFDPHEISDTKRDLITGKKILRSPRDRIEWQANKFASSILLPRLTVIDAVIEKQQEMDIRKNTGLIYLEDKYYSRRNYQSVVDSLRQVYQASKTAIEYRLKDLGILIDRRDQNTRHISELLRSD